MPPAISWQARFPSHRISSGVFYAVPAKPNKICNHKANFSHDSLKMLIRASLTKALLTSTLCSNLLFWGPLWHSSPQEHDRIYFQARKPHENGNASQTSHRTIPRSKCQSNVSQTLVRKTASSGAQAKKYGTNSSLHAHANTRGMTPRVRRPIDLRHPAFPTPHMIAPRRTLLANCGCPGAKTHSFPGLRLPFCKPFWPPGLLQF